MKLLTRKIGARSLGDLPGFIASNADHSEQIYDRFIDFSWHDILIANG